MIIIIKRNVPKTVSAIQFPLVYPFSCLLSHFSTDYRSEEAKERRQKRSAEYKLKVQKQLMLDNQLKEDQLRLETQKELNKTLQLPKELMIAAQQATSTFVVTPTNSPTDE